MWFDSFAKNFRTICTEILKLQNEAIISSVSYLEYTMLRVDFIQRRYKATVFVYNHDSYLDKKQRIVGEYDISFLFVHFDSLWEVLLSLRRRYIGQIKAREIKSFMLLALPDFYSYLINIARFALTDLIAESPFTEIAKNNSFRINVGDYMEVTETVFQREQKKEEKVKYPNRFGDFSGLDFSGRDFISANLRYSQFRKSVFNNTILYNCDLIGSNFNNAIMESCRLDCSFIYEADFSGAVLRNASFISARGKSGLINEDEWVQVGFFPVSFRQADLTNADFTGAILSGADFSGAILNGVNFTCTELDGAIFDDDGKDAMPSRL